MQIFCTARCVPFFVIKPLTLNDLPQTEKQIERAKESVAIATNHALPNLVRVRTDEEVESSGVLGELFNQ